MSIKIIILFFICYLIASFSLAITNYSSYSSGVPASDSAASAYNSAVFASKSNIPASKSTASESTFASSLSLANFNSAALANFVFVSLYLFGNRIWLYKNWNDWMYSAS